jgi:type IV pilus assembly protein PilX
MLKRIPTLARAPRAAAQRGVVLLIALVVLLAVMIAGIAMMRTVDTATLVSGNIAFQRAATNAADKGVEAAVKWLKDNPTALQDNGTGYIAYFSADEHNPGAGVSWQQFWTTTLADKAYDVGTDDFQNHIWYVVNRLCNTNGVAGSAGCVASPAVTNNNYVDHENPVAIKVVTRIYYRITVKVAGPRRTESYVQTHIAM